MKDGRTYFGVLYSVMAAFGFFLMLYALNLPTTYRMNAVVWSVFLGTALCFLFSEMFLQRYLYRLILLLAGLSIFMGVVAVILIAISSLWKMERLFVADQWYGFAIFLMACSIPNFLIIANILFVEQDVIVEEKTSPKAEFSAAT